MLESKEFFGEEKSEKGGVNNSLEIERVFVMPLKLRELGGVK